MTGAGQPGVSPGYDQNGTLLGLGVAVVGLLVAEQPLESATRAKPLERESLRCPKSPTPAALPFVGKGELTSK